MAVTTTSFQLERPEFQPAGAELIAANIALALQRVSADEFGDAYDQAVSLMTAHLLWSSPYGVAMRRDGGEDAESPYLTEFLALRRERIPSILVI